MSAEVNKKIGLAYVDAFNRGDEQTMRPLFTADALIYGVLGFASATALKATSTCAMNFMVKFSSH